MKKDVLILSALAFATGVVCAVTEPTINPTADEGNAFRVTPYVQHPATNAVTLMWLAQTNGNATVSWWVAGSSDVSTIDTATEIDHTARVAESRFTALDVLQYCRAPEFGYTNSVEAADNYPSYLRETVGASQEGAGWSMPYTIPYQYRVRLTGLLPDTTYGYRVTLEGGASYTKTFRTAPAGWRNIRFTLFSDSETEPADNPLSTGRTTDWSDPATGANRTYYATQTEAYASNVAAVVAFKPDLIVMAGDLAQKGSRQNDWDEFWRHNAGALNDPAGSTPIVASPGNHDYWSYNDGGERAIQKYISYFEFEPNGTSVDADVQERFHRVDYGPATFLFMDANNGDDSDASKDTNRPLARTDDDPSTLVAPLGRGCRAPDFNEGSAQYQWLETQLADAQKKSAFIFIVCHQCPYSVGDHGRPNGEGGEKWSGRALRALEPLFHRYGVTAWLCGHDEMMERSEIYGTETCTNGTTRPHTIHVWDMGVAGDGLRGKTVIENPDEQYRAGVDSPEVYDADGILTDGGKHYGHLEVTITNRADGAWVATFDPVYEFFTTNAQGAAVFGGTRHYPDLVTVVNTDTVTDAAPETKTWVGADNVWAKDSNWSPAGVPRPNDRVVIGQTAALTPTTTFNGEMVVTAGTLALTAESDLDFSLAVKTGARFEKYGEGNLRVTAIPLLEAGFVTDGTVAVAEGLMTFASSGQTEAPGFFGPLEVAADAEAVIADSPATGRHGGLCRALKNYGTSDIGPAETYFKTLVEPYSAANLTASWQAAGTNETLSGDGYWKFISNDVDGVYPFSDCAGVLTAFKNHYSYVTCTRSLLVSPATSADFHYRCYWRAAPVIDGTRVGAIGRYDAGAGETRTLAAGWHAFDEVDCPYNGNTACPNTRAFYASAAGTQEGVLNEDMLWSGVAFGGLTLAEGAKLTVPANQAVAFAGTGATLAAGSIEVAAGAVFALMGGTWTTDWDLFTSFAGTFELGRYATLTPGDADLASLGGTIDWRGTVVASSGLTGLQSRFTGSLVVPEGVTVSADEALLAAITVSGAGQVAVSSEIGVGTARNSEATLALQTGGKITSGFSDLLSNPKTVTISGFENPAAWWTMSNSVAAGTEHAGARIADGKITLVDAAGMQMSAAWLQTQTVGVDNPLDLSFKLQQTQCDYPEYGASGATSLAEGITFLLQGEGLELFSTDPPRDCSYGFEIYGYGGMKFYWVVNGTALGETRLDNYDGTPRYGFAIGEPISARVGLTNGLMTVTLAQENGAVYAVSHDMRAAFWNHDRLYMGFTAGTGTGKNYFKGDVWDVAGTLETTETVTGDDVDPTQAVTADNWVFTGGSITNGSQLALQEPQNGVNNHCICANALSPYVPFNIRFDITFDGMAPGATGYWAEGWGLSLQDQMSFSGVKSRLIPQVHNGMTFYLNDYEGAYRYVKMVSSANTTLQTSAVDPGGVKRIFGETGTVHVNCVYDGAGTMTVELTQPSNGASYTMTQTFDNYANMTDDKMYLTFTSASGTGGHYVLKRVSNLVVAKYSDNGTCPLATPVAVAGGASATVETYSLAEEPTQGEYLTDLTLGLGSTLTAALSDGLLGGWIGFEKVTAAAGATLASGANLVTALDTIVLTGDQPGPLVVTGDWKTRTGTLTVVIPSAWRRASNFYVLKADLARCQDATPPTLVVQDETGKRLHFSVQQAADGYILRKRGVAVFVR